MLRAVEGVVEEPEDPSVGDGQAEDGRHEVQVRAHAVEVGVVPVRHQEARRGVTALVLRVLVLPNVCLGLVRQRNVL